MSGSTLAFLATGLVVGTLSGLLGIGGAVVLIPALVFLFKFSQPMAQGTSIAALVPPIGIFAAIQYYRTGNMDVRAALFIALGFLFGAYLGAVAVPHVPQQWLKRAFATLLMYVAVKMMLSDATRKLGSVLPGAVAIGALWGLYFLQRAFGKKVQPPKKKGGPKAPPGDEYYI